ncbi:F-box domain [Macleaya cordata]|uniref:F-box domain n=1 Tax=Macleaya cordata TaxID=56857 RepID=A0A200R2H0_MACCD|nr:F-box domain [Macleaya cordata]
MEDREEHLIGRTQEDEELESRSLAPACQHDIAITEALDGGFHHDPAIIKTLDGEFKKLDLEGNNENQKEVPEEKTISMEEKGRKFQYPLRFDEFDGSFYLWCRTCGYGSDCRFNHPPRNKDPVRSPLHFSESVKEKIKEEYPEMAGQPKCKIIKTMVKEKENQKVLKGQSNMCQGGDMISKLPDSLLHHILSFLTTKCAACTCILSKRWRYVWTNTPNLDFLHWRSPTAKDLHLETESFMGFVDGILIFRNTPIKKFGLKCDELCDESRMNAWISTVLMRKVEELNLNIKGDKPFLIPLSLFTCISLIELTLQTYSFLYLPRTISFPSLKILRLFHIIFRDESLTEQLFHNSPVLEELILSDCTWLNMKTVCISAPSLKCLCIDGPNTANADGLRNCEVKIHAPSLVSLTYKASVAKEYVLSNFSSLVDAEIAFVIEKNCWKTGQEEIGRSATKLFGGLSDVKSLIVSGETLEALSYANDLLIDLPTFNNLIHLGVTSQFQCSADKALFNLLEMAPNLESLVFDKVFPPCQSIDNVGGVLNTMTGCVFLHLKSVHFKEFSGSAREMDLATLFLKNAIDLQKMTIRSSVFLFENLNMKVEVMKHILRFSRSSKSCEIEVS